MAYETTVWQDGDVITSDGLNNLEEGVSSIDTTVAVLATAVESKADIATLDNRLQALGIVDLGNFTLSVAAENKAAEQSVWNNPLNRILVYTINQQQNGMILNNVTETGAEQILFLKGIQYTRTVTASGASKWADTTYATLPNKAVNGVTLFKLTTEASDGDIKAALSAGGELITEDDLNTCMLKGYLLREYSMQTSGIFVGFNGNAFTLTYFGPPNPVNSASVMEIAISVTDGVYKVTKNGSRGVLVTSNTIAENSVIKALTDRVAALEAAKQA